MLLHVLAQFVKSFFVGGLIGFSVCAPTLPVRPLQAGQHAIDGGGCDFHFFDPLGLGGKPPGHCRQKNRAGLFHHFWRGRTQQSPEGLQRRLLLLTGVCFEFGHDLEKHLAVPRSRKRMGDVAVLGVLLLELGFAQNRPHQPQQRTDPLQALARFMDCAGLIASSAGFSQSPRDLLQPNAPEFLANGFVELETVSHGLLFAAANTPLRCRGQRAVASLTFCSYEKSITGS